MTHAEKIARFAALVKAQTTAAFTADYAKSAAVPEILEKHTSVRVKPGAKYTKVDVGDSGRFMIDASGNIFGIKGYGVIHRGHWYGTLDTIGEYRWGGHNWGTKLPTAAPPDGIGI